MAAAVGQPPSAFLDLGSGGGVPGLPLLLTWPDTYGTLVESRRRRCRFLADGLTELGLADRAAVACGRAEELARQPGLRAACGLVVARSFASPAVTAECAVGFLAAGGLLVVSEPPAAAGSTDRWPEGPLDQLGLVLEGRVTTGAFGFVRLRRRGALGDRWPRRAPAKRPLWA